MVFTLLSNLRFRLEAHERNVANGVSVAIFPDTDSSDQRLEKRNFSWNLWLAVSRKRVLVKLPARAFWLIKYVQTCTYVGWFNLWGQSKKMLLIIFTRKRDLGSMHLQCQGKPGPTYKDKFLSKITLHWKSICIGRIWPRFVKFVDFE